ncbi:VOC family protein [Liquorilactobacillus capillatus]|nr:VOC family protein [Liquorilactobacillus capillatus]
MKKMIFVNLPVTDLQRSINFYEALGFKKNSDFSNETSAGMMWSNNIWIMLLTHEFYSSFLKKQTLANTQKTSGSITAFSLESIDAVKAFAETAKKHGGDFYHVDLDIPEEQMYELEVKDPDGNLLSVVWMNMPDTI